MSYEQKTGKQTIILILSWMGEKYNARNWTSSYRDQKSTIKRCKWKGVDVSFQMKWEVKFEMNMVPKMGTPPTNLSNTVNIFQHHQPTILPLFIGREVKKVNYKGELLCNLQDEPDWPGDVLHIQCTRRWGDLQVTSIMISIYLFYALHHFYAIKYSIEMHPESRSSPSLLQICKKKMFATPSKIHLGCLKGEFLIQLVFSFKYFSWPEL